MQFLAGRIFSSAAIACRQSVQQHAETAGRASHAGWELLPCPARKTRAPALVRGRQGGGQSRLADGSARAICRGASALPQTRMAVRFVGSKSGRQEAGECLLKSVLF